MKETSYHTIDDANYRQKLRVLSEVAAGAGREARLLPDGDPLAFALRVLAKAYRLPLAEASLAVEMPGSARKEEAPPRNGEAAQSFSQAAAWAERLRHIALRNRWRIRKVRLPEDFHTWNTVPLLGFAGPEGQPVAIFPRGNKSFFYDPQSGRETALTAATAAQFAPYAYRLYEILPETPLTWRDVARFVLADSRTSFVYVVIVGCFSGLLALAHPLAVEYVTGKIIPSANLAELWQVLVFLLALAGSQVLLGLAPKLYLLGQSIQRFERFSAAVFDRLFRIPVDFFRRYPAGDLSQRVTNLFEIQETLFNILTGRITLALYSLVSLALLLYYSWRLSLVGLLLIGLYCGLLLLALRRTAAARGELAAGKGRMSGMLAQFFDGIAKIRGSGAETRILARYLDEFIPSTQAAWTVQVYFGRLEVLAALLPPLVSLLFFWLVGSRLSGHTLELPQFLAFLAAFAGFQTGMLELCWGIWKLWMIKPELQRIQPVLQAEPESAFGHADPGHLDGHVAVRQVTFRYTKDQRPVLDQVSFHAAPGEFIALVGPSGAGKSSIVRLLLGFEQPESGGVYYSDRDLAGLDLAAVRRQLGVIMQNSRMVPGTIASNIIAGTEYTVADAERALREACLDEEIASMPMGIFTIVRDGLLSGGQQQRLMIARALVGDPKIVIMDESTSALDNITQENISKNIKKLNATRIVIAHRLSTIVDADRIYVLEQGRICQCGRFEELVKEPGPFRELARHQLL